MLVFGCLMETLVSFLRKQPPRGVLKKRCPENMQQIYRRTPMSKCDFNKVAKQLYWNRTSAWVFSCKFAAYFQNTFYQDHLGVAASVFSILWFPLSGSLIYFRYAHVVCTCDFYFSTTHTKGVDTKISLGVSNENQDLSSNNFFPCENFTCVFLRNINSEQILLTCLSN